MSNKLALIAAAILGLGTVRLALAQPKTIEEAKQAAEARRKDQQQKQADAIKKDREKQGLQSNEEMVGYATDKGKVTGETIKDKKGKLRHRKPVHPRVITPPTQAYPQEGKQ